MPKATPTELQLPGEYKFSHFDADGNMQEISVEKLTKDKKVGADRLQCTNPQPAGLSAHTSVMHALSGCCGTFSSLGFSMKVSIILMRCARLAGGSFCSAWCVHAHLQSEAPSRLHREGTRTQGTSMLLRFSRIKASALAGTLWRFVLSAAGRAGNSLSRALDSVAAADIMFVFPLQVTAICRDYASCRRRVWTQWRAWQ